MSGNDLWPLGPDAAAVYSAHTLSLAETEPCRDALGSAETHNRFQQPGTHCRWYSFNERNQLQRCKHRCYSIRMRRRGCCTETSAHPKYTVYTLLISVEEKRLWGGGLSGLFGNCPSDQLPQPCYLFIHVACSHWFPPGRLVVHVILLLSELHPCRWGRWDYQPLSDQPASSEGPTLWQTHTHTHTVKSSTFHSTSALASLYLNSFLSLLVWDFTSLIAYLTDNETW